MAFGKQVKFRLDSTCPLRSQVGESRKHWERFLRWKGAGYPSWEDFSLDEGVAADTIKRYSNQFKWEERRQLDESSQLKGIGERMYEGTVVKATESGLLPAPQPIARGLTAFALRYGHVIAPGFKIDSLMAVFLTELEKWVEGEQDFLMLNPHPRSGKSTAAVLAMAYSYLRYPTRSQILISASGRLAALSNQRLKTLIETALPEPYALSKDSKSKMAFSGNYEGAGLMYAASRGGQLMGLTGNRILCDDLISSTQDIESPEIMATANRTMTTDLFTRLTADSYGKGSGICFIAQRISNNDLVAEMINRERQNERDGIPGTPWVVVATPFVSPTKEEQARIIDSYPSGWTVKQAQYPEVGTPVSSRFDMQFLQVLQSNMSPRDYQAMYCLNTATDDYNAWKRSYLQEIDDEDINLTATFIAVDMALVGGKGRDESALVAAGVQDGNVIITGLHFLKGATEDQLAQIVEYAEKYQAHTVGVESAAMGHYVLKSLSNNIGSKTFNVTAISHRGKNKGARLSEILGPASNKKLYIRKGLDLSETLHSQLRLIATTSGKTHKNDDLGDCACMAVYHCWNSWIKSGFTGTSVSWQGGSGGSPGVTECTWGYGTSAGTYRPSIDGGQYFCPWS